MGFYIAGRPAYPRDALQHVLARIVALRCIAAICSIWHRRMAPADGAAPMLRTDAGGVPREVLATFDVLVRSVPEPTAAEYAKFRMSQSYIPVDGRWLVTHTELLATESAAAGNALLKVWGCVPAQLQLDRDRERLAMVWWW